MGVQYVATLESDWRRFVCAFQKVYFLTLHCSSKKELTKPSMSLLDALTSNSPSKYPHEHLHGAAAGRRTRVVLSRLKVATAEQNNGRRAGDRKRCGVGGGLHSQAVM